MGIYRGTRIGSPKGRVPFSGAPRAHSVFDPAEHEGEMLLIRPMSYALRRLEPAPGADESDTDVVGLQQPGDPRPQRVVLADVSILTGEDADTVLRGATFTQSSLLDALESVLHDEKTDLLAGTVRKERGVWRLSPLSSVEARRAWRRAQELEWAQGCGSAAARLAMNIRREREARGIHQADLGAPAGLDQTRISRIEGGRRAVSAIEAHEFAKFLGVDLSSLLS